MKTALLVIDMQQYFSDMAKKATPSIQALQKHFSATGKPIIYTQHGHPESDFEPPYRNQLVRKWGAEGCIRRGSSDWELIPWVRESVGASPVVAKNTYDAFVGTELAAKLEGIERVVVCGVMTDCCCETTARSAFNRGWETWLVGDACYSADEEQHQRSLADYDFGYGPVWTAREVIGALEKEG
ncbi:Isochorismatase-like protein [Pestalotiopsis sp. NC0098]|nr:Isochorismatase-like protein [Pestalotiopsis sp. NC0098]